MCPTQMTVKSNCPIAIATLGDWLKKTLMLIFQPMGSKTKTKTNGTLKVRFSRALSKLQVIARNLDWFIALFDPIVIDRSCEVWYRFFDSHLKTALSTSLGISCSKLLKCVKLHLGLFLTQQQKKKKKKKSYSKMSSCV